MGKNREKELKERKEKQGKRKRDVEKSQY